MDTNSIRPLSWYLSVLLGTALLAMCRVSAEELTAPDLHLANPIRCFEDRLFSWSETCLITESPGRSLTSRLPSPITLENPWDVVHQGRVPVEYCPTYWPEHEPMKTLDELCHRELLTNWQLQQDAAVNPLWVAAEQADAYTRNSTELQQRLLWAAVYAWIHRGYSDTLEGVADALISEDRRVEYDVLTTLAASVVVKRLPKAMTEITAVEGEAAVDLRFTAGFAHDSVAQFEESLVTAARRGLQALAIAGRGQLGDARLAQRVADKLKLAGRLPRTFRLIPAEYIKTRGGDVLALYLRERIIEGMTMGATVEAIHAQGGLAFMARPGDIGAAPYLYRLPFDGYLMQPGNFELFRTLKLLHDPNLARKPALYASNLPYTWSPGLPHSSVPLQPEVADPIYTGLAQHQGYAAGALYLPWMMFLLTKPVAIYQGTLNRYFELNDYLALRATELLRADGVILRTSWDEAMRDLINLAGAPGTVRDLAAGDSPLLDFPRLMYFEAEYGHVAWGYDRSRRLWTLGGRWQW